MRARMTPVAAPAERDRCLRHRRRWRGQLNISTAVTFVLAACGVPVAKHGNRALSSRAGGADVLMALGVNIEPPLDRLPEILAEAGCVFLFAPRHHPALRHAAPARVELGTRTIFNLTGPLANPARVKRQLIGVFRPGLGAADGGDAGALGTEAAWVVHGSGLDELTLAGENQVVALKDGEITEFTLNAADAGLQPAPLEAITGRRCGAQCGGAAALLDGRRNALSRYGIVQRRGGVDRGGRTTSLARRGGPGGRGDRQRCGCAVCWTRCSTASQECEARMNDARWCRTIFWRGSAPIRAPEVARRKQAHAASTRSSARRAMRTSRAALAGR